MKFTNTFKFNNNISNSLSNKGVQWHFIPLAAPHFLGASESMVKGMKYHLLRAIGLATLKFEQLTTLLTRL